MILQEATVHFNSIANVPFGNLFSEDAMSGIIRDKGRAGKLLERAIGLSNTNANRDFEDGELKTYKSNVSGKPLETIAITQISSHIEDLIAAVPFEQTWLYEKICNVLYIPVCKEGAITEWLFLPSLHVELTSPKCANITKQLKEDYEYICSEIKRTCESGKMLSTISGKYIQIRTKDSAPYHPIYSSSCERNISDKNRAFYFKKEFILAIREVF